MTEPLDAWRTPAAELALAPGDVHVWRVPLVQPAAAIAVLKRALGDDERAQAARFRHARDHDGYVIARGALRALAGRYLGHPPDALRFGYLDKGKPYLAVPAGELRFNVSHSGEVGLIAFAHGREIGVDLEYRLPLGDLLPLAQISFSRHEYAALCGLPPAVRPEAFFACWSRKEAFIKATGEGVAQLADFDVSLRPGEPARLLRIDGPWSRRHWSLRELPAIPGYASALVVEGPDPRVECWDWPVAK